MNGNPWDVSNILLANRSGELLGQGISQAGQALGGAIAQYGQVVAQGLDKYYEKQQKKQLEDQAVSTFQNIAKQNPQIAASLGLRDISDVGAIKAAVTSLGGAPQALQFANYVNAFQRQQQEDVARAKVMQDISMMNQFGGAGAAAQPYQNTVDRLNALEKMPAGTSVMQRMGALSPGAGPGVLSPQAGAQIQAMQQNPFMRAQQQFVGSTGQLASPKDLIDYAQAQATMKKPQGQFMTAAQFNAYKEQNKGMDIKAIPVDGGVMVTGLGTYAPKADTNVSVNAGESAYRKTLGEEAAKSQMELYKSAKVATKTLPKLNETLKLIETGDVSTGVFADVEKNINRVKAKFLNDAKAGKAVSDTEYLDALLGSDVFPMIGELGIGARGLDTPAEREFLRSVFTGSIPLNKETLKRLTETRRNIQLRAINEYNAQVDSGELDDFFEATKFRKKKFEVPGGQSGQSTQSSVITVDY